MIFDRFILFLPNFSSFLIQQNSPSLDRIELLIVTVVTLKIFPSPSFIDSLEIFEFTEFWIILKSGKVKVAKLAVVEFVLQKMA